MEDPRTATRRDGPDLPLRQVGPYQLQGIAGAGRTGAVFLARRAGIDRTFALKLLPPAPDAEEEARALREARVASRLSHPGIARVLEVGRHQERLYVVMEHVPGPTLRELVEKGGPMPSAEAAELVAQLADALGVAHRAGVVHRDVSARNVVVDDRSGRPRLVDFGLASEREAPQQLTRAGQVLGSPEAAAPEQLRGEAVDARADVYSLGVLLYELLTATRPFEGTDVPDVMRRVLSTRPADRPPPPSRCAPGVDRRVEAACSRAMAQRPEERFPTAAALADALRDPPEAAAPRAASRLLARAATTALAVTVTAGAAGALLVVVARARGEAGAHAAALERAQARLSSAEAAAATAGDELAAAERALAGLEARRAALERARGQVMVAREQDARRARAAASAFSAPDPRATRVVDALLERLAPLVHAEAAALRAELHIGRDRPAQALEEARAAGDVLLELRCLARLERRDELRALVDVVQRDAPADSDARRLARLLSGDPSVLQGLSQAAPTPLLVSLSDALGREGLRASDPRLLEQAVAAADAAVRGEPACVEALYARSSALYHRWVVTKDPALVPGYMRDLYRARALSPRAMFWIHAGKSFVMNDRPGDAMAELEHAAALAAESRDAPAAAMAWAWLGAAVVQRGDPDAALNLWLEALRLAPEHPSTYDFVPWARGLSSAARARLLSAVPPARRDEVERDLRAQ